VVVLGIAAVFGYTILEPVTKAERGARFQTHFFVCDFFTLSLLIAIPLFFISNVRSINGEELTVTILLGLILVAVFVYSWARGATALSAIGVVNSWKRCCFLGVLVPIAILGSALVVPTLIMLAFFLTNMPPRGIMLWLAAVVVTPLVAYLCRRCTRWVIADPKPNPSS